MLAASRKSIERALPDDALVLDIGGWADPFWRADWVMDVMPFETRGLYERNGWVEQRDHSADRFGADTWVARDICDREPYPFEDEQFDFVICSHTLEDLRDPLWVCGEMVRVGKAGYIEVPSRLEEQSWGVAGAYVGWAHHRWLIDVEPDSVWFTQKLHSIHAEPEHYLPDGFWHLLSDEERVETLWWTEGFAFSERILHSGEEASAYLRPLVEHGLKLHPVRKQSAHGRRWLGRRDRLRR